MGSRIMKNNIYKILITVITFLLFSNSLYAATFTIIPNSGTVRKDREFVTDIMIDTKGDSSLLSRVVLTFDHTKLKVIKAENNESLYCDYPEDKQSVDNTNGVIVLTGFCQSGNGVGYKTTGEPDLFARITYVPIKAGDIEINWEYSGIDEEFKSIIMKDGSPTTSILLSAPTDAKFKSVDTNIIVTPPPVTALGVTISWTMIIVGIILVILGIIITTISLRYTSKRGLRTLVEYE